MTGTASEAPAGLVGQARAAEARKDWHLAVERWGECLKRFPNDPSAWNWRNRRASVLRAAGRLAEAEQEYCAIALARPKAPAGLVGQAKVALDRRDWTTSIAHWDECIRRFEADPAVQSWRVARANCVLEDGRLSEAEDELRALAAALPDDPDPLIGLARIAEIRKDWAAVIELMDRCLAQFAAHDSSLQWRAKRAISLQRLRDWPAALAAWEPLIAQPEMRRRALLGRAQCLLEWFGPSERAAHAIEEALDNFPNDRQGLTLHARLATERMEHRLAMTRWALLVERHPNEMMYYRNSVEAACRCGDPAFAISLIEKAPSGLAESVKFKCGVRLHYYRRYRATAQGLSIVEELDPTAIDVTSAVYVCQFLADLGLFQEMERFAKEVLIQFPTDKALLGHYLEATCLGSGTEKFEAEKARRLSVLPETIAASVLSRLRPAWLTTHEAKRVIDWIMASFRNEAKKANQLLGVAFHPDPETLAYLAERLGDEDDIAYRLFGRLLLAAVRDQHRIARANLGGVSWPRFEEELVSLRRDTRDLLAGAEAQRLPRRFLETAVRLERACERSRTAWLSTGESWFEAASLAAWLTKRIADGTPTSVIRLGDGEGNFLPYSAKDAAFQAEDQRQIQQIWWGAPKLSEAEAADLASQLEASIRRADAVGVPPLKRLLKDLNNPSIDSTQNCRGLCSAIEFVERQPEAESKNRLLLSLHLHSDLDRWDLFRQIFAPVSSVSVISCLDLSRLLAERFGVGIRTWYRIPPEFRYRSILTEPGYQPERPFYPDLFEEIMADVTPRPGELFLVAAGFLGKILCDRIRERGGIGFDIGSQPDSWMGRATRFYTGAALEFDSASSLIEGQPFADRFDAQTISHAEPCRSDRTRRTNLTGRFDALFEPPNPTLPEYALRVIGHPRCGSTYVAVVLSTLGLHIGHERPAADGLCSWIHAVEDLDPPFEARWLPPRAFRGTMAYVRDPATAIPSIMLENTNAATFDFRRFHIARATGVDIAQRRDPLERALDSYMCWTDIVERQRPLLTMRVERLLEDVAAHSEAFETLGLRIEPAAMAKAAGVPRNVNTSQRRFALAKPLIEAGRYDALPADLRDRLARFCERYDYALPK
jgi:tetratricopeptide (TPR) repeat protein